jgi:hypothetical protein
MPRAKPGAGDEKMRPTVVWGRDEVRQGMERGPCTACNSLDEAMTKTERRTVVKSDRRLRLLPCHSSLDILGV